LRIVDLLAIDSTISWREFRGAGQRTRIIGNWLKTEARYLAS
jgi:hypothetical protein